MAENADACLDGSDRRPKRGVSSMTEMRLKIAVVGGPMYDRLYEERLPAFTAETGIAVEVGARLIHPELNDHLAAAYAAGTGDYDLISTHGKYAPAQVGWLRPLDDILPPGALDDFSATTVAMARIDGVLFGVPRNVDTRLLHYRSDLFDDPAERTEFEAQFGYPLQSPRTWTELAEVARHFSRPPDLYGFAFPGQESGLWGQFYELVESAGGRFFGPDLRAAFDSPEGGWALDFLRRLYGEWAVAPPETPEWQFDAVSAAFDTGRVAMIGDWPAAYGIHAASPVGDRFDLALYPAGSQRRAVYSGGFTWAVPRSSRHPEAAIRLALHLSDEKSQMVEARQGTMVPRRSVQVAIRAEVAPGTRDERRLALLEETVATSMLVPPRFTAYPAVERAVWPVLQAGFMGTVPVERALRDAAAAMDAVVGGR